MRLSFAFCSRSRAVSTPVVGNHKPGSEEGAFPHPQRNMSTSLTPIPSYVRLFPALTARPRMLRVLALQL